MRLLGLDVGEKRVGAALSDELGVAAQPLEVIEAGRSFATAIGRIRELCTEHEVATIVIGMPLSMSGGGRGASARKAKDLGDRLASGLRVEVVYVDERFTTAQAERMLVSAGVRRERRRGVVDKIAAALILQAYLDGRQAQH
ncbi:MAG: Holliday junction resolvase RuvX [Deltaproteobacteria bacterium]|nr:Holliday junction resolvase RuvX [Deltaproteobacteria bacterium]